MKTVSVLLQDREGNCRVHTYECEEENLDTVVFMWEDGNYACDCNRSLMLYRLDFDDAKPCSSSRPLIRVVMLWIDGVERYWEPALAA